MEEKKAREWTAEQLSAINTRNKTLLVSAAAGSGKTATLTERIIRSLTDTDSPIDINNLLIVTFTRAAASELKVKITKALEEAVRQNPENKGLEKQLYLLPSAKIRTIDGFCNDILKNNTDAVGISPAYRLLDSAEEELLASNILSGMIDALYAAEMPDIAASEDFERLTDCLSESKKSESVCEVFRLVYSKLETEVEGVDALLPLIEKLDPESFTTVEKSEYGKRMLSELKECAEHYIKIYSEYERLLIESGGEKYLSVAESDTELLRSMSRGEYKSIRELFLRDKLFVDMPRVKDKTPEMEEFKAYRDEAKAAISGFERYFYYSVEEWRELYKQIYPLLRIFYRFLSHFDRLFFEEKKRRSSFSYSDIARLAYSCLIKDGSPTDIARSMKKQFAAVYIDEYQDVNPLQNSIFEALSRENNRFMVGDIKQSIYVFRKAKPEIFASMKAAFPKLSDAEGNEAGIFMSKNFRSDEGIIDFVNGIFDKIFSLAGQSIGYEDADRLTLGKNCDGIPYRKPVICLVKKGEEPLCDEPTVVALKIKELIDSGKKNDGSPIAASDIAILLRSAHNKDVLYAEALKKLGIPSVVAAKEDFFLTPEVLLTLSVLNSIDNPRRDIYLAGYMLSPLAGFTADELYEIKNERGGGCLYDSLLSYTAAHGDFEKGKAFIRRLDYYRTIAEGVGVDELLYKLYHETGLLALAAKNGGKDNLTLLYDYAVSYESGAFEGLYNFIHFINNLTGKKDTEFDAKREGAEADAVKIMTCHSSKGLEYPVVFLADCGNRISNNDLSNRITYSDELGLAFRLRTPSGLLPVDNPVRDIINLHNSSKMYEEELRILYVALTRAREQLFLVGSSPLSDSDKYLERCRRRSEHLDAYVAKNLSSFLEIAVSAVGVEGVVDQYELLCDGGAEYLRAAEHEQAAALEKEDCDDGTEVKERRAEDISEKNGIDLELKDELVRRFTYSYPDRLLCELPEKMSVSKTGPRVLDGADEYELNLFDGQAENEKRQLPRFAESLPAEESAKRGIATHYLLQFCDLENLKSKGGREELARLVGGGFISDADAKRVRIDEIERFRDSELFEKMLGAKKLYRELRFTVKIPAASLTSEEERRAAYGDKTILVQGVIDCIVEDKDGSLYLYDYKTDRLTREELSDRALAQQTLKSKHSLQLSYYALAVKEIFGREPKAVEVYSLHLGDTVDVSL